MALPNFNELRKYDISQHTDKRDGFEYLNWAKCFDLLHELGAEKVEFSPLTNPEDHQSSLFMSGLEFKDKNGNITRAYEVRVKVTIDDKEYTEHYPLINGKYIVNDSNLTQRSIHNAVARAFVKCVAKNTGLGFSLWLGDDIEKETSPQYHDIKMVRRQVQERVTALIQKDYSIKEIAKKMEISEKIFDQYMKQYNGLVEFEERLKKVR